MAPSPTELPRIETIAFDADDTLWHNEVLYDEAQDRLRELLGANHDAERFVDELYETETRNLEIFGYGIKGFGLSMIETAIEMSRGQVTAAEIQAILDEVKGMLRAPVSVLDGVTDTLKDLADDHELMVITKGDLFDQEAKIARSGLGELFQHVEVVSAKTETTYRNIVQKYELDPQRLLMVGNSLKSDILPVVAIGARAVHIPYATTWKHELVHAEDLPRVDFHTLDSMHALPRFVRSLG